MSGDNVIRPTFGRPSAQPVRQEQEVPEPDMLDDYKHIGPLEGEALRRARLDLVYMLSHKEHVNAMRDRLESLGDMIFSLANFSPDKRSIELRRQGLKQDSLEEICTKVAALNELQCRSQPSYVGALTLEHSARVQIALSLIGGESTP